MDAFELYNSKGTPSGVWCCGKCKKLVLSPLYDSRIEQSAKSTQEGAEACCRPRLCTVCQVELSPNQYRTESLCDRHQSEQQRATYAESQRKRLEAATLVVDHTGPLYCDDYSGDWGYGYHSSIDSLAEVIADSEHIYDENGNLDPESIPEFVFCCTEEVKGLDIDNMLENLCSDGYEGMADCIEIPDSLKKAVDEFNTDNAKALTVYNQDSKRKVAVREYVLDFMKATAAEEPVDANPTSHP